MNDSNLISLMVLDPGHFHATLVQKQMYPGISKKVYVYAPEGMELDDYIQRIESYNSREDSPTSWELEVYTG
ncbi:MAG: oxidoreductase, partial [Bacteroidales bacterium]|nr:oxidoreductase [Bacteroidales bacterium]